MTLEVKISKVQDSSNIDAIGYLMEGNLLFIRFNWSGATYAYHQVPATCFADLRDAKSKGDFFNRQVKPFFAASVINPGGVYKFVFIDSNVEVVGLPRPTMKAVVDARWNW